LNSGIKRVSLAAEPRSMQTLTLRFHSLSELTTFSKMVNEGCRLDTGNLTISGSFANPFVVIAQNFFDATIV